MKAEHIHALTRAIKYILNHYLHVEATLGQPKPVKNMIESDRVSAIIGLNGELEGQMICTMSESTAKKIIGSMMGGVTVTEIDDMGWSAIQEFGNWVAGTAATELSKESCIVDVTPPIINEGDSKFHLKHTFLTLPLTSPIGEIKVHVSLREQKVS